MAATYRLVHTAEYDVELRHISLGSDILEQLLQNGAYHILRNDPTRGALLRNQDLHVISQQIVRNVMMVRIYYRIDTASREVVLVSIREVDMTTM